MSACEFTVRIFDDEHSVPSSFSVAHRKTRRILQLPGEVSVLIQHGQHPTDPVRITIEGPLPNDVLIPEAVRTRLVVGQNPPITLDVTHERYVKRFYGKRTESLPFIYEGTLPHPTSPRPTFSQEQ